MKFKKFINECRENEVFKNLSIYIVSSWVLIQVVGVVTNPLGLPEASLTYLLILLILGFPLYIYLLWKLQIAEKVKRKPMLDDTGNPIPGKYKKSPFQRIYFYSLAIISLLAVSIVVKVVDSKFNYEPLITEFAEGNKTSANSFDKKNPLAEDKIAVLRFENNTNMDQYDLVGKMASDEIVHGIAKNKLGQVQVISPDVINEYSKLLVASINSTNDSTVVTDYLNASRIIKGDCYLVAGDRFRFNCRITDRDMNTTLHAFDAVECGTDDPLDCIETLKDRILGYLVSEEDDGSKMEDSPPSFEAYSYFDMAKTRYLENPDDSESMRLLDRAIDSDSSYFEPKLYKFMHFYNSEEYRAADSILSELNENRGPNERQSNFLGYYEALLRGDNRAAYEYQQREYRLTPFDLETNANMMTVALQLVNKPQEIDSVFREIDMNDFRADLSKCYFCLERYKIRAMAHIEMKQYQEAIGLLERFEEPQGYYMLKRILLRALIKAAEYPRVDEILARLSRPSDIDIWTNFTLFTAKELLIAGEDTRANAYFEDIVSRLEGEPNLAVYMKEILAESYYFSKHYDNAEKILVEIMESSTDPHAYRAMLASSYHHLGKAAQAQAEIDELEQMWAPYQYGNAYYALARYYASIGEEEKTMDYLEDALGEGHWFETSAFQNDPFFKSYLDTESFNSVMNIYSY